MVVRTAARHVSSITKDNRGGKVTIIASVPALSSSFPFSGYQPSSPWLNYTGLGVTGPDVIPPLDNALACGQISSIDRSQQKGISLHNTSDNYRFFQ